MFLPLPGADGIWRCCIFHVRLPPISLLFFLFWFLTIIPTQETRASAATIRRSAGSPHGLRRNNPQEVHRLWELRREQFLFFQETLTRPWLLTCGTSSTGYFLTLFCAICFFHGQFSSFCHVRSMEDEMLSPLVFTWSPRGPEVWWRELTALVCAGIFLPLLTLPPPLLYSVPCCGCSLWKCGKRRWTSVPSQSTPE